MDTLQASLIQKYNVPAPRYTSYPTVPFWDKEAPSARKWLEVVNRTFAESNASKGISMYIHLLFAKHYVPIVVVIPA